MSIPSLYLSHTSFSSLIQQLVVIICCCVVVAASDCFRLAQQSFNNLEFELSEMWYGKGLDLLHARQPLTQEEMAKIEAVTRQQATRSMMVSSVVHLFLYVGKNSHDYNTF